MSCESWESETPVSPSSVPSPERRLPSPSPARRWLHRGTESSCLRVGFLMASPPAGPQTLGRLLFVGLRGRPIPQTAGGRQREGMGSARAPRSPSDRSGAVPALLPTHRDSCRWSVPCFTDRIVPQELKTGVPPGELLQLGRTIGAPCYSEARRNRLTGFSPVTAGDTWRPQRHATIGAVRSCRDRVAGNPATFHPQRDGR